MYDSKKLEKQLNKNCGAALQYLQALGIDTEKFIAEAVTEHLNSWHDRLVGATEKKLGLPSSLLYRGTQWLAQKSLAVRESNRRALSKRAEPPYRDMLAISR